LPAIAGIPSRARRSNALPTDQKRKVAHAKSQAAR
jgi:hypothetical protein